MLFRGAARKPQADPYRYLQPLADQLLLPWLCPAQCIRYHHFELGSTTNGGGREKRKSRADWSRPRLIQRRNQSTAVAEREPSYEDYIPFEDWSTPVNHTPIAAPHRWSGSTRLTDLRPSDTSSLIVLNEKPLGSALKSRVKGIDGMSTDVGEIHNTLEACLRVDRFERAAALVRRLAQAVYTPDAPELLSVHNRYLSALVTYILRSRSESHLRSMQTWFEVEMIAKGVEPNATTYALLLKASIQMLESPQLERTIRRYMDLAVFRGKDEEVFGLPILSDAELNRIAQVCPTEYNHVDQEFSEPRGEDPGQFRAMPALRSVQQKGLGLEALKKSISIFSTDPLPYPDDLKGTKEEKDLAYAIMRQKKIEDDSIASAVERWQEENQALQKLGFNTVLQTRPLGALMWEWHVLLKTELEKELKLIDESEGKDLKSQEEVDRRTYGPFLRLLPVEKLSAITILAAMGLFSTNNCARPVYLSAFITHISESVHKESTAETIQKQAIFRSSSKSNMADRQQKLANLMKRRRTFEALARGLSKHDGEFVVSEEPTNQSWSLAIKVKVGVVLVSALLRTAKLTVPRTNSDTKEQVFIDEPAFFHTYQTVRGKRIGVLITHPQLGEQLRKEPPRYSLARHLPMIVEPKKWKSFSEGGFLGYPVNVMRIKDHGFQRRYIEAAARRGDMAQIFGALDFLARTPWRVNRRIFEIMAEAWNSGEAVANFAPAEPKFDDPVEPEPSADHTSRRKWIRALRDVENQRGALHSLRCFQNFQLEVARAYANEKFYFPHNLDFRGRAYPTPPYLNHLQADNCRALLIFAEGKELGHSGLAWLKVHLANVYGYDKASFQERRDFAMEHLPDIYDSANNPLKGRRWWLTADDPWQCLATCIELRNALESPDPTRFISHLPIHQDGTCNGLQHYAALGGDEWGAKQVNLEPGDRPADVYNAVAELVRNQAVKDAAEGHVVAQKLLGKVTRKVVKQTVMTHVYGVTYIGAIEQVRRQLKETMPDLLQTQSVLNYGHLTHYVVQHIFRALSSMFNGAHEIQRWLGECAGRICDSLTPEQIERIRRKYSDSLSALSVTKLEEDIRFRSTVVWTTPLKMPVAQPYYKDKGRVIMTNLQRITLKEEHVTTSVNRRKQLQAFPPNFIHSLDASHMLLSALVCEEKGLTFAAVHDSFWTHASDVDSMNRILRDTFIRIHREDVMGRLAEEFRARYKGSIYLAKIRKSSAVAKKIMALRNSRTVKGGKGGCAVLKGRVKITELLEEHERQRLLRSDKPKERAKGRKMVTPASLFEELDASGEALVSEKGGEVVGIEHAGGDFTIESLEYMQLQDDIGGNFVSVDTDTNPIGDADFEETETETEEREGEQEDTLDDHDTEASTEKEPKKPKGTPKKVTLWLPLTFPPVPKKGNFDVSRLADSKYFFC